MSNPADRVLGTPPTNTSLQMPSGPLAESAGEIETGLAIQQREREKTLHNLARLREEASAEIDRLLAFLDASHEYVMSEREEAVDDEACDDTELEPSLGSFDRMTDQSKAWRQQSLWAFPEVDGEQDDCDREDDDPNEAKEQPLELGLFGGGADVNSVSPELLAVQTHTAN